MVIQKNILIFESQSFQQYIGFGFLRFCLIMSLKWGNCQGHFQFKYGHIAEHPKKEQSSPFSSISEKKDPILNISTIS